MGLAVLEGASNISIGTGTTLLLTSILISATRSILINTLTELDIKSIDFKP
jgi:hypothetical protein